MLFYRKENWEKEIVFSGYVIVKKRLFLKCSLVEIIMWFNFCCWIVGGKFCFDDEGMVFY